MSELLLETADRARGRLTSVVGDFALRTSAFLRAAWAGGASHQTALSSSVMHVASGTAEGESPGDADDDIERTESQESDDEPGFAIPRANVILGSLGTQHKDTTAYPDTAWRRREHEAVLRAVKAGRASIANGTEQLPGLYQNSPDTDPVDGS